MTASEPAGSSGDEPTDEWIAVLEFGRPDGGRPFLFDDIHALVAQLAERRPSGLWHPDRYAIQLHVRARNAQQGLQRALACHHEALRASSLGAATLIRIEVMTVEEYERSLDTEPYDAAAAPAAGGAPLGLLCDELYGATRSLHAAASARDITDTVIAFVLKSGGRVEPGAARLRPGTIDVDITLENSQPRHAIADSFSVAGLILEQSLPTLLDDARRALVRLQIPASDGRSEEPDPP